MVREGAHIQTPEPGNQPWINVKPRGAVRADEPGFVLRIFPRPSLARGVAEGEEQDDCNANP